MAGDIPKRLYTATVSAFNASATLVYTAPSLTTTVIRSVTYSGAGSTTWYSYRGSTSGTGVANTGTVCVGYMQINPSGSTYNNSNSPLVMPFIFTNTTGGSISWQNYGFFATLSTFIVLNPGDQLYLSCGYGPGGTQTSDNGGTLDFVLAGVESS